MKRLWVLAAAAGMAACAGGPGEAGSTAVVRGRVLFRSAKGLFPYSLNSDGSVRNVFVHIKEGLEGRTFAPASEARALDQKNFQFVPRVQGLRVGQALKVTSGDPSLHNVNASPFNNPAFNDSIYQGEEKTYRFGAPEIMIAIQCNLHPGMKAYVGVVEHPFFSVTGEDGAFEIGGLPPGEYTLEAWEENRGALRRRVRVGPGARETVTFTFE